MKKNIKKVVTLLLVMMLFFTNTMPTLAQETGNAVIYNDDSTVKTVIGEPVTFAIAQNRMTHSNSENADYAVSRTADVYTRSTTASEPSDGELWTFAFRYTTTIYYKMGYGNGPGNTTVKTGRPLYAETVIAEHDDSTFKLTKMEMQLGQAGVYYAASGGNSIGFANNKVTRQTTIKQDGFEVGDRALSYYNTENYYSLNEASSGYAARTNFTAVRGTGTVTAEGVLVEMGQYAEMPDM